MSNNLKIKFYPVISVLLFHFAIIKIYYVNNYNNISIFFGIIVLLYLLTKINIIFLKKYSKVNTILFLLSFVFVISALYNLKNVNGTLLYIMKLVELFWFFEYVNEIGKKKNVAKIFIFLFLVYQILNYCLILKDPLIAWKNDLNYLIGSKFSVSYSCLSILVLFIYGYCDEIKQKNRFKIYLLLLIIFLLLITLKVKCTTGLIGLIVFLIIYFFSFKKFRDFISKPKTAIITILICCSILLLFYNYIMNISIVKYVITDVFDKNLNLTGRAAVYNNVLPYISNRFFIGYGYNNIYELFNYNMQIGADAYALNSQNALLEYWLYGGIFAVILFLVLTYTIFKNNYLNESKIKNYALVVAIITLMFLGSVEITINMFFFMFLAFLNIGFEKKIGG